MTEEEIDEPWVHLCGGMNLPRNEGISPQSDKQQKQASKPASHTDTSDFAMTLQTRTPAHVFFFFLKCESTCLWNVIGMHAPKNVGSFFLSFFCRLLLLLLILSKVICNIRSSLCFPYRRGGVVSRPCPTLAYKLSKPTVLRYFLSNTYHTSARLQYKTHGLGSFSAPGSYPFPHPSFLIFCNKCTHTHTILRSLLASFQTHCYTLSPSSLSNLALLHHHPSILLISGASVVRRGDGLATLLAVVVGDLARERRERKGGREGGRSENE